MSEQSEGCWVVFVRDWNMIFKAVFPAHQEAEARRFCMENYYECEFMKWGEEA
jgi:hypothetical protein